MQTKLLRAAAQLLLLASTLSGIDAQSDVCGIVPINTRIVGGEDAAPGAWPWQAMVVVEDTMFCGGSLINDQWVMTAAHCFLRTSTVGVTVYLGRQTHLGPNPNEQNRTVSQIIKHPQYNDTTLDNDIVLVKLSSPVTFTNYIRPVCLAAADSVYEVGPGWSVEFTVGDSCALPSALGGFTRVSRYESWIKSQITTNQPGFVTSSAFSSVGPATGVILTVLFSPHPLIG
ncbi:hypothetical protein INR49_006675, partial [Caranx melampygus]